MRSHSRATKDRCGNIFDFFKEIYSIFKKDLRKLYKYAREFHVLENVQSLMEVLYE